MKTKPRTHADHLARASLLRRIRDAMTTPFESVNKADRELTDAFVEGFGCTASLVKQLSPGTELILALMMLKGLPDLLTGAIRTADADAVEAQMVAAKAAAAAAAAPPAPPVEPAPAAPPAEPAEGGA